MIWILILHWRTEGSLQQAGYSGLAQGWIWGLYRNSKDKSRAAIDLGASRTTLLGVTSGEGKVCDLVRGRKICGCALYKTLMPVRSPQMVLLLGPHDLCYKAGAGQRAVHGP